MDYLIAATPRVGSNLFCSLLMGTKRLGEPREYLCPTEFGDFHARIERDPRAFSEYFEHCRESTSTGGVFGYKAHLAQLEAAVRMGFDVGRHFPDRVVYMTRSDVTAQALSHVRALQTGAWISKKAERAEPRFDAELIHAAVRLVVDENQAWEAFFRRNEIEPLRIGYEALCADFTGTLRGVLGFLDVDPDAVDVERVVASTQAYFSKQRDGLSAEWRERYGAWLRDRAEARRSPGFLANAAPARDLTAALGV